jgi:hypothetical protein
MPLALAELQEFFIFFLLPVEISKQTGVSERSAALVLQKVAVFEFAQATSTFVKRRVAFTRGSEPL